MKMPQVSEGKIHKGLIDEIQLKNLCIVRRASPNSALFNRLGSKKMKQEIVE